MVLEALIIPDFRGLHQAYQYHIPPVPGIHLGSRRQPQQSAQIDIGDDGNFLLQFARHHNQLQEVLDIFDMGFLGVIGFLEPAVETGEIGDDGADETVAPDAAAASQFAIFDRPNRAGVIIRRHLRCLWFINFLLNQPILRLLHCPECFFLRSF